MLDLLFPVPELNSLGVRGGILRGNPWQTLDRKQATFHLHRLRNTGIISLAPAWLQGAACLGTCDEGWEVSVCGRGMRGFWEKLRSRTDCRCVRSSHDMDFTGGSLMTSPGGHSLLLQRRVTCDFCCTCDFSNMRTCRASQQKHLRSLVTFVSSAPETIMRSTRMRLSRVGMT